MEWVLYIVVALSMGWGIDQGTAISTEKMSFADATLSETAKTKIPQDFMGAPVKDRKMIETKEEHPSYVSYIRLVSATCVQTR